MIRITQFCTKTRSTRSELDIFSVPGRLYMVVFAILLLPLTTDASSLWRFGFYWSITANTYPPTHIPWQDYSHIAQLSILPTDQCEIDDTSYNVKATQTSLVETAHSQGVKVLISLLHDKQLTAIARCTTPNNIANFVGTLTGYVDEHEYDGIDLDWEAGVVPSQYKALVRQLRAAMPTKIITVDIAVHQRRYVSDVQDQIDRINLMNYDMGSTDYHGNPLRKTWHNAAIRPDVVNKNHKSAEANLSYLLASGIAAQKVNLGVPFYGYIIQGCAYRSKGSKCSSGIRSLKQPYIKSEMHRTQVEYNKLLASPYVKGIAQWDNVSKAPFIKYKGKTPSCAKYPCDSDAFITYSDPQQMREAVSLVQEMKLGGIMTFALHQEYLSGKTGDARYPLTSAITHALSNGHK